MSSNFSLFQSSFSADPIPCGPVRWTAADTVGFVGVRDDAYIEFMCETARASYNGGLLRFLLPGTKPSLVKWNSEDGLFAGWPQARRFFRAFAFDWQGNQLGFDQRFKAGGVRRISVLELGTGS